MHVIIADDAHVRGSEQQEMRSSVLTHARGEMNTPTTSSLHHCVEAVRHILLELMSQPSARDT